MPWISDNYEKVALAGTLLIAVALGYSGLQSRNAVEVDFSSVPVGGGDDDPSIKDGDKVATSISSWQIKQQWNKAEKDGRPVDLFTGVPLFVNKSNLRQPVDLPNSPDVHSPIPNQWWIDYRIDPGFGDSPHRDEDGDGFSNIEEFDAKTDPTDNRSHPSLIEKLVYVGDESVEWVLRPSGSPPALNFQYDDNTKKNGIRTPLVSPIEKGGIFFSEGVVKERFKYLGFEVKIDQDREITMVKVEDLKPNKKGTIYEIPAGFRTSDARKFLKFDRSAIMTLEALGFSGQEFKVEEQTNFALPVESENKRYRIAEISPERIVVEETLEDGTNQRHEISKKP